MEGQNNDKKISGFTLIELLITMAILVILLSLGVPGFTTLLGNNRLASQANDLVYSLRMARSEAAKRGSEVRVAAIDGSDWSQGWKVVADTNRDGDYSDPVDILVESEALSNGSSLSVNAVNTSTTAYISYDAKGALIPNNASFSFELKPGDCAKFEARTITAEPSGHTSLSHGSCS